MGERHDEWRWDYVGQLAFRFLMDIADNFYRMKLIAVGGVVGQIGRGPGH
jgi:hypothetical protein